MLRSHCNLVSLRKALERRSEIIRHVSKHTPWSICEVNSTHRPTNFGHDWPSSPPSVAAIRPWRAGVWKLLHIHVQGNVSIHPWSDLRASAQRPARRNKLTVHVLSTSSPRVDAEIPNFGLSIMSEAAFWWALP